MRQPPRTLDTDVCILGGGSGGIGAAIAAARAGARVVLVERSEILGGTSTMAWVANWEPSVGGGGLPQEIWQRMSAIPLATPPLPYREGEPRRAVSVAELQGRLREQGVELPR